MIKGLDYVMTMVIRGENREGKRTRRAPSVGYKDLSSDGAGNSEGYEGAFRKRQKG
jgi:hypothetical protein